MYIFFHQIANIDNKHYYTSLGDKTNALMVLT